MLFKFNRASCILFGKLTYWQVNPSMPFLSRFLVSSIRNMDKGRETLKTSWESFWGGYIHGFGVRQGLIQTPCLTLPMWSPASDFPNWASFLHSKIRIIIPPLTSCCGDWNEVTLKHLGPCRSINTVLTILPFYLSAAVPSAWNALRPLPPPLGSFLHASPWHTHSIFSKLREMSLLFSDIVLESASLFPNVFLIKTEFSGSDTKFPSSPQV